MGLAAPAIATGDSALNWAQGGCTETVEVRRRLTSADVLCRLIAGFAHHRGGVIIFGYHPRKGRVVGCNQRRLERRYQEAVARLGNEITALRFYPAQGRSLGVIHVPAVNHLIPPYPVIRVQLGTRLMTREHLIQLIEKTKVEVSPTNLWVMVQTWGEELRRLREELERANGWRRILRNRIIGFVGGAIATAAVAYIREWTR